MRLIVILFLTFLLTSCINTGSSSHRVSVGNDQQVTNYVEIPIKAIKKKLYLDDLELTEDQYNDSVFIDTIILEHYLLISSPITFQEYYDLTTKYNVHEVIANRLHSYSDFDRERYELENLSSYREYIQTDSNCYFLKLLDGNFDTICDSRFVDRHPYWSRYTFADYNKKEGYYIFFGYDGEAPWRFIINASSGKRFSFNSYQIFHNQKILTCVETIDVGDYSPKLGVWEIRNDSLISIWKVEKWKNSWWPTNALWLNDSIIYYEHNMKVTRTTINPTGEEKYLRKLQIIKRPAANMQYST